MADRLTSLLIICIQMNGLVFGDYCQSEAKPSIPFCQSGTMSGSKVYINGSSVKTKEDLIDRGCVCYLEQVGNKVISVDAMESCFFCGLQVRVGNSVLRSIYYGSQTHGWGLIALNDTKVTMTLELDEMRGSLNSAFCIKIQENQPDTTFFLTLTCEDNVIGSSTASSTSPNVIVTSPNMVPDTTKSQSPTSAETAISLPKTETTNIPEVSTENTNVSHGPKANNTCTVTRITTTANDPGEPRFHTQKEEIDVAAAAVGFVVGAVVVILIDVVIFICYKRRIKKRDKQGSSTAPPRDYTDLEFNSRGGQNNSHVYNSIERHNTYVNDVQ